MFFIVLPLSESETGRNNDVVVAVLNLGLGCVVCSVSFGKGCVGMEFTVLSCVLVCEVDIPRFVAIA